MNVQPVPTPRVWIGCVRHYAAGFLVGQWFEAASADQVTVADVHAGSARAHVGCQELWCYDHEGLPVSGELSPFEAARWARRLAEVDAPLRPALIAWVESGCHVTDADGDLPDVAAFKERYCGRWDSFEHYANQLAEDIGLMDGWPDLAVQHFNWRGWTRDLRFEHTVCQADSDDADGPGVHVFSA